MVILLRVYLFLLLLLLVANDVVKVSGFIIPSIGGRTSCHESLNHLLQQQKQQQQQQQQHYQQQQNPITTATRRKTSLLAKATKKKKKGKNNGGGGGGGTAAGIKGFGAAPSIGGSGSSRSSSGGSSNNAVEMDRSKQARLFYEYLEQQGRSKAAGDNLKRCALGYFPLPGTNNIKLRGIVARRDIKKGENIINIPYELSMNLGQEGGDPTQPALELLRDYCQVMGLSNDNDSNDNNNNNNNHQRKSYYEMLPPFQGNDCLGSTDFFSDEALDALQSPLIVEETLKRRERTKRRYEQDIANNNTNFPRWIDGSPVTQEHLQWAVWLITSRVLTVQGDAQEGKSYRLLIPFLDMANHDRRSSHVLSGRAVPGGELKIVAGTTVRAGEQINICYGGGVAGNDRFIQDYGFLDSDVQAYEIVAQQLLGKRRILEGASAGKTITEADREAALKKLRSTTMEQDKELLQSETDIAIRSAIEFRLSVKKALSKQIIIQ